MDGMEWTTRFANIQHSTEIFSDPTLAKQLPGRATEVLLTTTLHNESQRMEWIASSVDSAWSSVEELIVANKTRLQTTDVLLADALDEDFAKCAAPWNDKRFRRHFRLTTVLDSDIDDDDILSEEDKCTGLIKLKTAVGNPMPSPSQPPSRRASPTRSSNDKESFVPDRYLLSINRFPDAHAPLRRCFSHILQRRDQLPVSLHKLLTHIQDAQQALSRIEAQMGNCLFHIPLHRPFQCIALLIVRELSKPPVGAAISSSFEAENRPLFNALLDSLRKVLVAHRDLEEMQRERAGITTEKADLGAHMWGVITTELEARKELHNRTISLIERVMEAEMQHAAGLQSVVESAAGEANALFEEMLAEAAAVTTTVKRLVAALSGIMQRCADNYAADSSRLDKTIAESGYRLTQSRKEQDKILRRIREQYKALQKEQQRHHDAYCHVLSATVHKKRLDHTYDSFKSAAEYRLDKLTSALHGCDLMRTTVEGAKTVADDLFVGIKQHVDREKNTEKVRKCNAAVVACENALEWRRVLGDLACLHTKRSEDVEQRHDSWQLDYLLSHQRKTTTEALQSVRENTTEMDQSWKKLKLLYLDPFDVAYPDLLAEVDSRKEVQTSRYIMVELESARKALRSRPVDSVPLASLLKDPKSVERRLDAFIASILPSTFPSPETSRTQKDDSKESLTTTAPVTGDASLAHPAPPRLRDPQLPMKIVVPAIQRLEKQLQQLHAESQEKKAAKAAGIKLPALVAAPSPDGTLLNTTASNTFQLSATSLGATSDAVNKPPSVSIVTRQSIRSQLDILRAQRRELDGSDADEIEPDATGFVPLSPVKRKDVFSPVVSLPSAAVVPPPNPSFVRKTLADGIASSRSTSPVRVPRPPLRV